MNNIIYQKIIYSAVAIMAIQCVSWILKKYAKHTQKKLHIRVSRYFAIKRLLSTLSIILGLFTLVIIWDVNVKNVWVSLTGVLALFAVAFFAVWSLIGNILAGIIIYFTSPFKIDDEIEIMPDEISGTVVAVNTFYTVILTQDKNFINIPNSMLFQKYIKVIKYKMDKTPENGTKSEA